MKSGHLSVSESQGCGQLSAIRFGDVFLQLEPFLQALALQIGENGPGPRSLAVGRTGTAAAAASATATSGMLYNRIGRSDRFRRLGRFSRHPAIFTILFFKDKFNVKKHKVPPGGLDATGGPWWRICQQPTSKVDQGLSKKKLVRMQNIPEYCCFLRNHFNDSSFTKNASIERRVERSTKTKCSSTFQTAPIFFFKRPIHCLFFTTDPSGFPFQMNPAPFSTFNGRDRR